MTNVMLFMHFFFKLLPNFTDFENSDDSIGKITSKSIRLQPVFIQKNNLKQIKKQIFSGGKLKNSDNYIYHYAHSFFGEDF